MRNLTLYRNTSDFFTNKNNYNTFQTNVLPVSGPSVIPFQPENDGQEHVISAISGSRALSNHILWRSAYRRDVNNLNLIFY